MELNTLVRDSTFDNGTRTALPLAVLLAQSPRLRLFVKRMQGFA
jgi:hypothetical protein